MEISNSFLFNTKLVFDLTTGVFNNLDLDTLESNIREKLELDYVWEYQSDPIITPTIIHEWDFLDILISKKVTSNSETVLSIGGGGNSRTHIHLSDLTTDLFILNPGTWDLKNYPSRYRNIVITKIRGIAEDLPFRDASIGAIEIPSTLDHVLDPKTVLSESFRVLKPNGKIGITLGNQVSWYRSTVKFFRIGFRDNHTHAHSFHFNPKDVEKLLKDAGFTNVQTIGTAYLKLPRFMEIRMGKDLILVIHRFISNRIMSHIFPPDKGGMFLVVGQKL